MDKFDKHRAGNRYISNSDDPHKYNDSIRLGGGDAPGYAYRQETYRGGGGGRGVSAQRSGFSGGGDAWEDLRPFESSPRHPLPHGGGDGSLGGGLRPIGDKVTDLPPIVGGERSGGGFRPMGGGGRGFRPIGGAAGGEFRAIGGGADGARFGPGGSGGGEIFRPMGAADGERFRPMGGGNGERFHPMSGGGDSERFGAMGGGDGRDDDRFGSMVSGGVDGERFQLMGGGGGRDDAGKFWPGRSDAYNLRPMGGGVKGGGDEMLRSLGRDDGGFGLDNIHGTPPSLSGQKRGYSFYGRERSPDQSDGGSFVKLFVGSVPRTATEVDIRPLFDKHGRVLEVALIKDKRTGQQQGCCFIKYASSEEADRAIRALHNQYILPGGLGPIQVRYADGERERLGATEFKLFVGSLNKNATEKEVEEIFLPYGRVEDVYLMRDEMKQSRGCGFVKYSQREMAQAAINALNGTYAMRGCEQPLNVRFADPKRPRPGESRGTPAFGGLGFGPRFPAPGIRSAPDLPEPLQVHVPPNSWPPASSTGPPSTSGMHGFDKQLPVRSGDVTVSSTPSMPPNITSANTQNLQGSKMQLVPVKIPHPAGETPANQDPLSRQVHGFNGQPHIRQPQGQHHASLTPGHAPGSADQQLPVQQIQSVSHSHSPSHLAQMLSQQKQTLQATFQSSQQAFNQLQQQVLQLQPPTQNLNARQGQQAIKQQSPWAGIASHPVANTPSVQQAGDAAPTTASFSVPAMDPAMANVNCSWTEHTSPDGYKYYYNSSTGESKWEKPEELMRYEQSRQHNKSYSQHPQMQSQTQGPSTQQFPQKRVLQGQHQAETPNQIQPLQHTSQLSCHQGPGVSAKHSSKELGYAQTPVGTGPGNDPTHYQQHIQVSQEWMWKNKPSGT